PCIARNLDVALQGGRQEYALSNDSDLFIYRSVRNLIRPVYGQGNKFQLLNKQQVLQHLQINDLQLLLLGIVTHNDYNMHFKGYGIATNMEIIKDLEQRQQLPTQLQVTFNASDVQTITTAVQQFVQEVTGVSPSQASSSTQPAPPALVWNFTDAIAVFTTMTENAAVQQQTPPVDYNVLVMARLVQLEQVKLLPRPARTTNSVVHQGHRHRPPHPPLAPSLAPSLAPPPPLVPSLPASAQPTVLYKAGQNNPLSVDRYDSVSPQTSCTRYNRKIIKDFTTSKMTPTYLQSQDRQSMRVKGPQTGKGKGPKRKLQSLTKCRHVLDAVFQTSALSVGSLKATLRYVTGSPLTHEDRATMASTINSAVTVLNDMRQYMFQAIPLYVVTKTQNNNG
ncbi:hypothetical protein BGX28_001333, partial [Mortierella sp. GBA30]